MKQDLSLLIVVPAYNSVNTLPLVISELDPKYKKYILVVDDGSSDETSRVAKSLGLEVIKHSTNKGCGAAQKTGFAQAISQKVDAVIILHADNQYDPKVIPELTSVFVNEECDMVLASRMLNPKWALEGGMPYWKFLCNKFSTALLNFAAKSRLSEFHTGYRLYSRKALERLSFDNYSDDHALDIEILLYAVACRMKIKEVPIKSRYFKAASSMGIKECTKYGIDIMRILFTRSKKQKR